MTACERGRYECRRAWGIIWWGDAVKDEGSGCQEIRVVVAAEFPAVRAGLRALLEADPALTVVLEAASVADLALDPPRMDMLVLYAPAERAARLAELALDVPVVVVGAAAEDAHAYLEIGVRGLLSADSGAEELSAAAQAAAQGLHVLYGEHVRRLLARVPGAGAAPSTLTPRELEVLQLIALGLPNKLIAERLGISRHTAKFHVSAVLSKLDAVSRAEAVAVGARRGLLVV